MNTNGRADYHPEVGVCRITAGHFWAVAGSFRRAVNRRTAEWVDRVPVKWQAMRDWRP